MNAILTEKISSGIALRTNAKIRDCNRTPKPHLRILLMRKYDYPILAMDRSLIVRC